ncbi:hypothetical protein NQ095_06050 [Rossellomorea sp. SC111]|nr:hypothetical protein [Rossellomorea sp. SC111]MCR8847963.1 hypothetical protein [Rossellomorea sp. SC111]
MNFIKILLGDKKRDSEECCQIEIKEVEQERGCSSEENEESSCC